MEDDVCPSNTDGIIELWHPCRGISLSCTQEERQLEQAVRPRYSMYLHARRGVALAFHQPHQCIQALRQSLFESPSFHLPCFSHFQSS
jgi:hypothetical protein